MVNSQNVVLLDFSKAEPLSVFLSGIFLLEWKHWEGRDADIVMTEEVRQGLGAPLSEVSLPAVRASELGRRAVLAAASPLIDHIRL